MIESSGDSDLAQKPVGAKRGRELGVKDLERDDAIVLGVLREIDRGHSATPQLAIDGVGRRKDLADALDWEGHMT